ncbi:hypothetical protein NE237_002190 [Protea cynaroides]|uniref:Uncharacterized protein n=1 Tax=Protea cynaroides TaxID=273540 RepID=A0A9Q0QZ56_9MAGN|nr:hypothetical protein NE237_002190 [Protea cynaroides]
MGLYSHLNYVSSDSIPILMVAVVTNCVGHLRSLLIGFFQSIGFSRLDMVDEVGDGLFGAVGSGLAELIVLVEQLNNNWVFSYSECGEKEGGATAGGSGFDSNCVVCLCKFRNGEQVRLEGERKGKRRVILVILLAFKIFQLKTKRVKCLMLIFVSSISYLGVVDVF